MQTSSIWLRVTDSLVFPENPTSNNVDSNFSLLTTLLPCILCDGYGHGHGHSSHGIGTACIVKARVVTNTIQIMNPNRAWLLDVARVWGAPSRSPKITVKKNNLFF